MMCRWHLLCVLLGLVLRECSAAFEGGDSNSLRKQISRHENNVKTHVTVALVKGWVEAHKPSDGVSQEFLTQNAELAVKAHNENAFASQVPHDVYLENVLPYTHFDEKADNWRPYFYETLQPFVKGKTSLLEAAEAVIPKVWTAFGKKIEFKSDQTPQVLAPVSELLEKGYASCTGMSIFLADCLRSVGIPARVAGVAQWNRPEKGNHNWVEVYDGKNWNFIDAVPSDKVEWNKAWFTQQGVVQKSRPHSKSGVYSPIWNKNADAYYEITWRDGKTPRLPAVELTSMYDSLPARAAVGNQTRAPGDYRPGV
jgi:hypothetical protein